MHTTQPLTGCRAAHSCACGCVGVVKAEGGSMVVGVVSVIIGARNRRETTAVCGRAGVTVKV